MLFIPTITSIWKCLDLEGVEEVLLTPKEVLLPKEPKTIIIDNGCWSVNTGRKGSEILLEHIEICKEIKDPRCIFILPDVEKDPEASLFYLDLFLKEVNPKRFSIVDLEFYHHRIDLFENSEFLSIPARRVHKANFDLEKYHLLGTTEISGARSWDDFCYKRECIVEEIKRRSR